MTISTAHSIGPPTTNVANQSSSTETDSLASASTALKSIEVTNPPSNKIELSAAEGWDLKTPSTKAILIGSTVAVVATAAVAVALLTGGISVPLTIYASLLIGSTFGSTSYSVSTLSSEKHASNPSNNFDPHYLQDQHDHFIEPFYDDFRDPFNPFN